MAAAKRGVFSKIEATAKEAELQNVWNKLLKMTDGVKLAANSDGIFNNKLFEFKFEEGFHRSGAWTRSAYKALAQSIYYLYRIAQMDYEGVDRLPTAVIVIEKHSGFVVPSQQLERILGNGEEGLDIDWRRAPSCPDPSLVEWLEKKAFFDTYDIRLHRFFDDGSVLAFRDSILNATFEPAQIEISEDNFMKIFTIWRKLFCESDLDPTVVADYYVLDINLKFHFLENSNVMYSRETQEEWVVPKEKYRAFWRYYKRPPSVKVQKYILSNKDCLYDIQTRDDTGDFYTPFPVARMARKYLNRAIPENERKSGLWWDPAAGGANLFIESASKQNIVLSTLLERDYRTLSSIASFDKSTIECFNFLKDALPESVQEQLKDDTKSPLIFLLNPPFNDQTGYSVGRDKNPNQVSNEFIRAEHRNDLSIRNLRGTYAKFMYRILEVATEAKRKTLYIGIFSKTAWLSGIDYAPFRAFWQRRFSLEGGFIVPSEVFRGTRGDWPVLFSVWKFRTKAAPKESPCQDLEIDILDERLHLIGRKTYRARTEGVRGLTSVVNKECLRDLLLEEFVPLKNECEVYDSERIYCQHLHKGAIGYMKCIANDVQNSDKRLVLLSAPYGGSNANGFSIVRDNFEDSMFVYAIRKSVKQNWLNDKDEFCVSDEIVRQPAYAEIRRKAILWSIIEGGYTSSLRDVKWKKKKYTIPNGFFALTVAELKKIRGVDLNFLPDENSLASKWIGSAKDDFTETEREALAAYKLLISETFKSGNRTNADPKSQCWNADASPRQLINGLFRYDGVKATAAEQEALSAYLASLQDLRNEIYTGMVILGIFSEADMFEDKEIESAA